ncbi:Envelope-like [Abeliophyllum distichum]|uniref:Envelope-like n=1 Tax=Abeliophyllum distichum TaxID=126358 RepID=A0ABD1VZ94_9LAMI
MAPQSKPSTSEKGKEIVDESNAHKIARPVAPTYELNVSGEAEQRATIFSSWSAIVEREVDLDSLNHTTLSAIIHDNRWTRLCSKPHSIYLEVVREFMVNFNLTITDEGKEHAYETHVQGVWVPFSPDVIGHFYGVPEGSDAPAITNWSTVARAIYPDEHPKPWPHSNVVRHGHMSDELRLLHSFMASNITPTTHLIEIYPARMTILYQMETGHNFNFGEHIFNIITDLASNPKGRSKLIFSDLISVLCKRAQVSMHSSEMDKVKTPILCLRSVRHSIGQVHRHANERRLAAELEGKDEDNSPANEDEPIESDTLFMPQRIQR